VQCGGRISIPPNCGVESPIIPVAQAAARTESTCPPSSGALTHGHQVWASTPGQSLRVRDTRLRISAHMTISHHPWPPLAVGRGVFPSHAIASHDPVGGNTVPPASARDRVLPFSPRRAPLSTCPGAQQPVRQRP
jgi:hypothetical protein